MDRQIKQSASNLSHETPSQSILKAVTEGDTLSLTRLLGEIKELSFHLRDKCAQDFLMSRLRSQDTGKSCLMEALLNINGKTPEIVHTLLSFTEKHGFLDRFINAKYTEENYRDQTALYIAIERRQSIIVKYLLDKGAEVNVRVQGRNNGSYFNETPLALAACTNQPDVVKLLMENSKTNVAIQDSLGNTVLHALITVSENAKPHITSIINIYDKIIRNCKDKHLERIKNNEGLKPMQLAAKTGKVEMLKYILSREITEKENRILSRKITVGASGPVSFSLYDLVGVDTSRPNSILQLLVYNTTIKNRHHELFALEPLQTLLQMKWNKYARYMFFISFVFYFAFTIILTHFSYRVFRHEIPITGNMSTLSEVLPYIAIHFSVIGALFLIVQESKALFKLKSSGLQSLLSNAWFHVLFLIQAVLAILSALHEYLLFTAMALGWINMLYYTRGFQSLHIYSVMIRRVIFYNVLKFILVYILFLLGFGAALASLTEHCPKGDCSFYNSVRTATVELFWLTIGLGNLEMQKNTRYPILFQLLLIIYGIVIILLLLKMLITSISINLDKIYKESENIWKLQRARTILTYEKGLTIYLRALLKLVEAVQFSENNLRVCLRVTEVKCTERHKEVTPAYEDEGLSQSDESVLSSVTSTDEVDVSKQKEHMIFQMKNEKNTGSSTLIGYV